MSAKQVVTIFGAAAAAFVGWFQYHYNVHKRKVLDSNQSIFYNNVVIGYNNNSLVTLNSKISDFKMHNGAQFNNTSTDLIIKHNNIFIDSNLSTNLSIKFAL